MSGPTFNIRLRLTTTYIPRRPSASVLLVDGHLVWVRELILRDMLRGLLRGISGVNVLLVPFLYLVLFAVLGTHRLVATYNERRHLSAVRLIRICRCSVKGASIG